MRWPPVRGAVGVPAGLLPAMAGQGNLVTAQTMLAKAALASEGGKRSRAASALLPWPRQRSMAEVTPLPALMASCSCQKTQAQRGGFRQRWRAQSSPGARGSRRPFPRQRQEPKLSNTLSCSVLAPHYNRAAGNLNYTTYYFST